MKAKEYLLQVQKLDRIIENKEAERRQWIALAASTSPPTMGERVKSSGNPQRMADAISRYVDLGREIDKYIEQQIDKRREIIETIQLLDDPAEYDILHKMYIGDVRGDKRYYVTFDEFADLYGRSKRWATAKHGNALCNLQKILDSRKDCY